MKLTSNVPAYFINPAPVQLYPCLMVSNGVVVLFFRERHGVVVAAMTDYIPGPHYTHGVWAKYVLGEFQSDWQMSMFTPFKGTVMIHSED